MFPLKERILIRGAAAHVRAGLEAGADYRANYVPFFIPFDGLAETYWGRQGGNWLRLKRPNGDRIELAHLSKYAVKPGIVKAGQLGGVTGNTGAVTDYAHLHVQIFNRAGQRLDPEKYDWADQPALKKTFMKITVVANNNEWAILAQKLRTVSERFKRDSGDRIEPVFDVIKSGFQNIPFEHNAVAVNWYRGNVTPLSTGQATLFIVNPDQWQAQGSFGSMTFGDPGKPVRMEVCALENEGEVFEQRVAHEIYHALLFLTGQTDAYVDNGVQKWVVHDYLYQNPPKSKELLNLINYAALQQKLATIKPQLMNQTKVVLGKDGKTVYEARPIAISFEEYKKQAAIEGIVVPNSIPKAADVL